MEQDIGSVLSELEYKMIENSKEDCLTQRVRKRLPNGEIVSVEITVKRERESLLNYYWIGHYMK